MEKKWNLQDIRPAEPRRKRREGMMQRPLERRAQPTEISSDDDGTVRISIDNGKKQKRTGFLWAFIVFFLIIGTGFIVSYLTGGAEVSVQPRTREPNVNATFTAYKTPKVGELSYEIMTLEAAGERQVTASGQEQVSEIATGVITIYNNTNNTERLIKNTRFKSPDGLIFKITESALVPASVTDSSGKKVPGSVEAKVFSDGTGEEYNIAANTRLTIPGYQESGLTELYENLYAINEAPMQGGFEGLKFIIDEQELITEQQRLRLELRNALLDRLPNEKPAGFVAFTDAVAFTYQTLPAVQYGENLATIKEEALLQIPLFKEEDFASYIAAATVPGYEEEPVRIEDYGILTFTYTSATTTATDIGAMDSLTFTLAGKPLIVWTFDQGKLKTDMLGKNKTALPAILGGYPAIEKAEATVRPFWKRSFPDELEAIAVTEVLEATNKGVTE